MIYIICTEHDKNGDVKSYYGFDTCAESDMSMSVKLLKTIIISNKIMVVNASLNNGNIVIKDWAYGLASNHGKVYGEELEAKYLGPKYVLIAVDNNRYKIVSYKGDVSYIAEKDFKTLVLTEQVANCNNLKDTNGEKIMMTDVCKMYRDDRFKKLIHSKYTAFTAKALMLGYGKITFKYIIEDREVKLTQYTGTSKNVIIPPFITCVMRGAFSGVQLETLKLSEGLKAIGKHSFRYNNLSSIEIPESVELVGSNAFAFNKKLTDSSNNLHKDRFKLRNNRTIVLTA